MDILERKNPKEAREPSETEIFVLIRNESISREAAIQLLKDFDWKTKFETKK